MAQLVEHHLAKVRVAGSNPVVRSKDNKGRETGFFWRRGQVVRQEPAKLLPPVRIWAPPPLYSKHKTWFRGSIEGALGI